jgi:hypothetical protein
MRLTMSAGAAALILAASTHGAVLDFEDLVNGAVYNVGDSVVSDGVTITFQSFTYGGGGTTSGGSATVQDDGDAGATGNEIWFNNILAEFDFGAPVNGLALHFGDYGGNENLRINGDLLNIADLSDAHLATVGGTSVTVVAGDPIGALFVFGTINDFAIGGQEFVIDRVVASVVPEPASLALLALVGAPALVMRRRA